MHGRVGSLRIPQVSLFRGAQEMGRAARVVRADRPRSLFGARGALESKRVLEFRRQSRVLLPKVVKAAKFLHPTLAEDEE